MLLIDFHIKDGPYAEVGKSLLLLSRLWNQLSWFLSIWPFEPTIVFISWFLGVELLRCAVWQVCVGTVSDGTGLRSTSAGWCSMWFPSCHTMSLVPMSFSLCSWDLHFHLTQYKLKHKSILWERLETKLWQPIAAPTPTSIPSSLVAFIGMQWWPFRALWGQEGFQLLPGKSSNLCPRLKG
jgi:hypothetical protein